MINHKSAAIDDAVLEWWESLPVTDVLATETNYQAVLRNRASWNVYTECPHQHRTREAAQRCADGWLLRNDPR